LKQQLAEISKDEAEISGLKDEVTAVNQKLAAANTELDSLKAARPATTGPSDDAKAVADERDKLKEELAERSKDLADAEAHNNQELMTLRTSLQQAEQQRDDLEKKLAATPPENSLSSRQVEQLQAKLAVLEADPVPYTPEEIAAMNKSPAPAPEAAPAPSTPAAPSNPTPMAPPPATTAAAAAPAPSTNATLTPHIYSTQDLPPGVGALWADAQRASMDHDYDTAEQKFKDVLRQDATNVFVLDHLAEAQFAANHLDACEKTVQQAISIDPNDPASLYLMGLLRYRQNRLDEALDALSLSAKLNPTNSATENFLGCVLAEKGLRPAAETALRKSLECDPDNADAHFNLAVVYAGNHPPSVELARWHYKKAVALGHQRSATLDKLLENP
jgi:tetratricopeptide (TPR) repeat protein